MLGENRGVCQAGGDNTLFGGVSVGGVGIMVLQASFGDLQPFSPAALFTLEGIMSVSERQENILTSVSHKGLH